MTTIYETPGVYIEEVTGAGVIQGVSTSVAAFVGPTARGPVNRPVRITSYDQFLAIFGTTDDRGRPFGHVRVGQRPLYTSFGVQGFFENGGRRCHVVNVSNAVQSSLDLLNIGGNAFARVLAREPGSGGDDISVTVTPNATQFPVVQATAALDQNPAGPQPANPPGTFVFAAQNGHTVITGDVLVDPAAAPPVPMTVVSVDGDWLILDTDPAGAGNLESEDIHPGATQLRTDAAGVAAVRSGMALAIEDGNNIEFAVVQSVDTSGFVRLAPTPVRAATIAHGGPTTITPQTFSLAATLNGTTETLDDLSLQPTSARYLFASGLVQFDTLPVDVREADPPPIDPLSASSPAPVANANLQGGIDGNPATLGAAEYQFGINTLRTVDDVNIVCIPDTGGITNNLVRNQVYQALIGHCLAMQDRIAIIDPPPNLDPAGAAGIEGVRADVQSERGFAALYYPWVEILDPWATPPRPPRQLALPPSGYVAGVMARVDSQRGVFKAPANETIRGVLGVQRRLTDGEQGPLNVGGTNVLRILPGSNAVTIWGARTTVDPVVTDWIYVNVRRLLFFIEESVKLGIGWAVFEPNDRSLWKSLERVIRAFLRQQWRTGALFGAEEDEAFRVRIDDALNPPAVRNVGRLNIEIQVAPVRPAEFIVVRIGLFDGGAEVEEV